MQAQASLALLPMMPTMPPMALAWEVCDGEVPAACMVPVVLDAFRKVGGTVFRWRQRATRMHEALVRLGNRLDAQEVMRAYAEIVAWMPEGARVRLAAEGSCGRVRIRVALAPSPLPARPRLVRRAWPFHPPPRPAKLAHDYALMCLAWADAPPAEGEVVVWVWQGQVCSAAWGNLLVRHRGVWWTPPVGPGVLDGVVRRALLEAGAVREGKIPETMLDQAEAAAITNGGVFVRAAGAWEGRALADAPVRTLRDALAGEPGWPAGGEGW